MTPQKRDRQKQRRQEKRNAGICVDCPKPVFPGKTRCLQCLEMDNSRCRKYIRNNPEKCAESKRKQRERRIKNKECTSCGAPLDEEDAERCCMNCSQRIFYEDYKPYIAT